MLVQYINSENEVDINAVSIGLSSAVVFQILENHDNIKQTDDLRKLLPDLVEMRRIDNIFHTITYIRFEQ